MLNWEPETTYSESRSTNLVDLDAFRTVCIAALTVDNLAGRNGKAGGKVAFQVSYGPEAHSVSQAGSGIRVSPSSGCWRRSSRAPAMQGG